jgi:triacylglycerol esterase/lipase EstA (alpha/beta hydrolase family)
VTIVMVTSTAANASLLSELVNGVALNLPLAGANPLFGRPSSTRPHPVILVHGVLANQNVAWEAVAPTLANAGYCVYTFTYGQVVYSGNLGGIADINASATQLSSFVNTVRSWTGRVHGGHGRALRGWQPDPPLHQERRRCDQSAHIRESGRRQHGSAVDEWDPHCR